MIEIEHDTLRRRSSRVPAALMNGLHGLITERVGTAASILVFGTKSTEYSAPR